MKNSSLFILDIRFRKYIEKMTDFMVVTKSVVDVFITSNIASFTSQKKFDKESKN